jgi:hypothetical protein
LKLQFDDEEEDLHVEVDIVEDYEHVILCKPKEDEEEIVVVHIQCVGAAFVFGPVTISIFDT